MSSPVESESTPVDRRLLLRGGAVLAGATVLAAAGRTPEASAADGAELIIGRTNEGASSTTLTSAPAGTAPTFVLANKTGPSLRLSTIPDTFEDGELQVGDIVNTDLGPLIGVDYGDGAGPRVDILATGTDLSLMPTPVAISPERILDTRTAGGRTSIVRRSASLTAAGKVKAGQWIDVAVDTATGDYGLSAIFANVTVVSPEGNGFASVYPVMDEKEPRPAASTINYRAGESLANGLFVGLGVYKGDYVVRIYTAQTSHLIFDLSGAVVGAPTEQPSATARAAGSTKNRRVQRQAKQAARIKDSLRRS